MKFSYLVSFSFGCLHDVGFGGVVFYSNDPITSFENLNELGKLIVQNLQISNPRILNLQRLDKQI